MKNFMLNHGIDILRKRFTLKNYNKDEVDIFIESINGFDTVRIEGVTGYDRIFLYNEFGCSYWGQEDFSNCSLMRLCYMQVYKILTDRQFKKYIL